MKNLVKAIALLIPILLIGCDNGTSMNAPTREEIDKANIARAKAIDEDKTITPEGKAKMKEMLGLNKGQKDAGKGR